MADGEVKDAVTLAVVMARFHEHVNREFNAMVCRFYGVAIDAKCTAKFMVMDAAFASKTVRRFRLRHNASSNSGPGFQIRRFSF